MYTHVNDKINRVKTLKQSFSFPNLYTKYFAETLFMIDFLLLTQKHSKRTAPLELQQCEWDSVKKQ